MISDSVRVGQAVDLLINGLTQLSDDGRFHEPNLDGSLGDYVSFASWEWPQGVGLYGLVQLWLQRDKDPHLGNIIEQWYDDAFARSQPKLNVNTSAPLLALTVYWANTQNPKYGQILDDWAERLLVEATRTRFDAFQHDVSDKINNGELWDDTLFMIGLFLAAYGQASGKRKFVDEAEKQFLVHAQFLADKATGLWYHGWTFEGRHNFANARWARGNAWITAGIIDLFELAKISPSVRSHLSSLLIDLVQTLLPLQRPSGMWGTLLDDPESYEETSATAGFAYGLLKGARLGYGDETWRDAGKKAVNAVLNNISEDGIVLGVSYGTRMGRDLQFYKDIPIQPTAYGQSLAILALAEASQLPNIKAGDA